MQVLLGILERSKDLTDFQAPQGDAAGTSNQTPTKWAPLREYPSSGPLHGTNGMSSACLKTYIST